MKYTQGTIGVILILSIDKSRNIKCYVDADFLVHRYMGIRTGDFTTMVIGRSYIQYRKQRLNTKSST